MFLHASSAGSRYAFVVCAIRVCIVLYFSWKCSFVFMTLQVFRMCFMILELHDIPKMLSDVSVNATVGNTIDEHVSELSLKIKFNKLSASCFYRLPPGETIVSITRECHLSCVSEVPRQPWLCDV